MGAFDDYVDDNVNEQSDLVCVELPEGDCSEVESIRWVANNISRVDVSPADCPSAIGWTLLLECRKNAGFRIEFLTKMWPKLLPSRAQLDSKQESDKVDGKVTLDMLARIQGIKDNAEESTRPEPEPEDDNYQKFEDYSQ